MCGWRYNLACKHRPDRESVHAASGLAMITVSSLHFALERQPWEQLSTHFRPYAVPNNGIIIQSTKGNIVFLLNLVELQLVVTSLAFS